MKTLYQIRLLLSYFLLLIIVVFSVYLIISAFTDFPFLIPTIVFFSILLILLVLGLLEHSVVKKKTNKYQESIHNNDFRSLLNEKIRIFYSTEIKMMLVEYKAICNTFIGSYNDAKELFEKIPYRFFLCNPELALQCIFYLMIISLIERDKEQIQKLIILYSKRKKAFKRYYTEKQLPFFDRRINNPDIMIKKIRILQLICEDKKDYDNQLLVLFLHHKNTKLFDDIQQIFNKTT